MRFGIVVSDPDDWTAKSLRNAFLERNEDVNFLNFSELSAFIGTCVQLTSREIGLTKLDGIIVRDLGRGKPTDVAFRFEVLRALEELGIPVINPPEAIARAANKFATSVVLEKAGLPTPVTTVTSSLKVALEFLTEYKMAVSKPLFGYKGRGIVLLTEKDAIILRTILESQGIVYLQEFVHLESLRDIRAFVVGGEVIGAIYRVAPAGAWISNLAKGGKAEPCTITHELRDLAAGACRAVGAVYSGVDLLETSEGLKVIEVNGTPSGKGIFDALGVDVTATIADHLISLQPSSRLRRSK
jgi:tetrahydromethanopterin:alpha-L-glutamate ligase